jgi:hypothetical protein
MTSGFQMDRCQKNEYDVISKHQIPSKSSDVCGTTIVAENRSLAVHDSTHVKKSKIEKIMEYQVPGTGKTARTHWKKKQKLNLFCLIACLTVSPATPLGVGTFGKSSNISDNSITSYVN